MLHISLCNLIHVCFSKSGDLKDKIEFSTAGDFFCTVFKKIEGTILKKIEGTVPCSHNTVT